MSGVVYAICAGDAVKIGVTGNSVESRLSEMQTGNPVELKIWVQYKPRLMGAYRLERLIHDRLRDHKIRGEWFFPTKPVMEVLEAMQDEYIENLVEKGDG